MKNTKKCQQIAQLNKSNMKTKTFIYRSGRCSYCYKPVYMNMGTNSQPMCERCWEKGGDDC